MARLRTELEVCVKEEENNIIIDDLAINYLRLYVMQYYNIV